MSTSSVLEKIQPLISEDLKMVNKAITDLANSEVSLIPKITSHVITSGGKRLRPILTLLSSKLCNYSGQRHINLAACVEFIHTATLLHDDVVDESDLRRGNATANSVWGNQASVLVGDFLLSRAFQLMVDDGSLEVLKILSDTSAVISEGEVMQLSSMHDLGLLEEKYTRIISAKTARLFAAACEIGAVLSKETKEKRDALFAYGENLGIAFQIVDDLLDYSAKQEALGKTIGDDFREGKVTLPVIYALQKANKEEKEFWVRTIEKHEQKDGDLMAAVTIIKKHGALDTSIKKAFYYAEKGKKALNVFPDSLEKKALTELIEFSVNREY